MTEQTIHTQVLGSGPPLVLLHGWGWHSGIWQPLLPHLADKFQLFLVDLPGFGNSTLQKISYTHDHLAKEIFCMVPDQAHWIGWSLGGMIAWEIALNYPERVNSLITIASSPKFVQTETWPGVSPEILTKFSELLAEDAQKSLQDFLELQLRGSTQQAPLLAQLKNLFVDTQFSHAALQESLQLLQRIDLRSRLQDLSVPSLHLFGSNDTLVPVEVAKIIAPQLKFGRCEVIKRSGHLLFLSQMESFLKLVGEFIG